MIFSKITKKSLVAGGISILLLLFSMCSRLLLNVQLPKISEGFSELIRFSSIFRNIGIIGITGALGSTIELKKVSFKGVVKLLCEVLAYTLPITGFVFAVNVQSIQRNTFIAAFLPFLEKTYWFTATILAGSLLLAILGQ